MVRASEVHQGPQHPGDHGEGRFRSGKEKSKAAVPQEPDRRNRSSGQGSSPRREGEAAGAQH